MRTIIYGAGAVGSVIGARLVQAGRAVVLVARGAHLDAIRRDGLRLRAPDGEVCLRIPVVAHPREIGLRDDDFVLLTMKSQDTAPALRDLEEAPGAIDVPVVSCQNGVENERLIARRFARTYAMLSWVPATFLEPGVVSGEGHPLSAILPIGRYPRGIDDTAFSIAATLLGERIFSAADPRVMELKYTKLLSNLDNGVQAITGDYDHDDDARSLSTRLREEALACYRAAGVAWASEEAYAELMTRSTTVAIGGVERRRGSTWQSLERGASVEVDYLNGEIALLGRLHGVPTPANVTVQRVCNRMAAAGSKPGRCTSSELLAMVRAASR